MCLRGSGAGRGLWGWGSSPVARSSPSGGCVEGGTTWTGYDLGLGTGLPGVESQLGHLLTGGLGSYSSFLCLSFPFCATRIIVTLRTV